MRETFRTSMGDLHTWAGVIISAMLFAIFWMGTLSVFDAEIDQWMKPETRISEPSSFSYDALISKSAEVADGDVKGLYMMAPSFRTPVASVYYETYNEKYGSIYYDADADEALDVTKSEAGTGFIFPFHFSFHVRWASLGYWAVGFCGMAMMVLLTSGIFIHRKIIADFFVFRPQKNARRSVLDMHNITGLIALPFHFLISLSGILIFFSMYLPLGVSVATDGEPDAFYEELYPEIEREHSGTPRPLASVDDMVAQAETAWSAALGTPSGHDRVIIDNVGDAAATIQVVDYFPSRRVESSRFSMTFDGATGAVLDSYEAPTVLRSMNWLSGFHFMQFDHWPLRWLFFIGGLSGCVMIATGLMFWIQARIKKGALDPLKVRAVRGMSIGSVTGIIAATLAFFAVNRLLPKEAALFGMDRAALEMATFFIIWVASFGHAALRGKAAWKDQTAVIAALAFLAVGLNWLTTGDHLIATAQHGLWSVFGMDMVLIFSAITAGASVVRLQKTEHFEATTPSRRRSRTAITAAEATPAE